MLVINVPDDIKSIDVIKRALFLAYNASQVYGAGILQKRNGVTENDVFQNAAFSGDYPSHHGVGINAIRADYVFGRMMKLSMEINNDKNTILVYKDETDIEYQSWGKVYETHTKLVEAAIKSLKTINN